jgi:hypothetical protein
MEEQEDAGWKAIESAFTSIYGNQEPKHWGTLLPYSLGGKDPLHGISAYKAVVDGQCHWHLVSFGLTELWAKESCRTGLRPLVAIWSTKPAGT